MRDARVGPADVSPQARKTVEEIVQAVQHGDDLRIQDLLAVLAKSADTATLLYLRERLYAEQSNS